LSGFCWDERCGGDEPIQDDPTLQDYNVESRVNDFVSGVLDIANKTAGKNIFLQMGSDFHYENAHMWFKNLDKLIQHVNNDGRVTAFYSTPLNYTRAKQAEGLTFTVKTDDFFPYADNSHGYWTGYFTSRPALKRFVRDASAQLQVTRQLELFSGSSSAVFSAPLWEAVAIAQHHDAVSGTAKQHVTYDYAKRIALGLTVANDFSAKVLGLIAGKGNENNAPALFYCPLTNISLCNPSAQSAGATLVILLYNGLASAQTQLVSIPVYYSTAAVVDSANKAVQFNCYRNIPTAATAKKNSANFTTQFLATVQPMGFSTYFITAKAANEGERSAGKPHLIDVAISKKQILASARGSIKVAHKTAATPTTIENSYWKLSFDGASGLLSSAYDKLNSASYTISQNFFYYQSYWGIGEQNSGAYIFRPVETQGQNPLTPLAADAATIAQVVQTNVSAHVVQQFNGWASQIVRLVADSPVIEIEWTIGPVDVRDYVGKEIVTKYSVQGLSTNSTWWSDSNGREFQQRIRNYRPTWKWDPTEPIAGNYYPVNTAAYTQSAQATLGVVVDRSQGVTSLQDGELEFMIHRRILHDDSKGVSEPLNETESCTSYAAFGGFQRVGPGLVITGKHYLVLAPNAQASKLLRPLQSRVYQPLTKALAPLGSNSISSYLSSHTLAYSFISGLPVNVELITLQVLSKNSLLLRFAHLYGINEDAQYSKPVTVDIGQLFTSIKVTSITEMSLTNNQEKSAMKKPQWKTYDDEEEQEGQDKFKGLHASSFIIAPMEIRTFQVGFIPQ
jgi:alpha-mannosidase